jgi:hypothetical protein
MDHTFRDVDMCGAQSVEHLGVKKIHQAIQQKINQLYGKQYDSNNTPVTKERH